MTEKTDAYREELISLHAVLGKLDHTRFGLVQVVADIDFSKPLSPADAAALDAAIGRVYEAARELRESWHPLDHAAVICWDCGARALAGSGALESCYKCGGPNVAIVTGPLTDERIRVLMGRLPADTD